jgi:L-seryl-tRNA(Ser) seleniumtransferase
MGSYTELLRRLPAVETVLADPRLDGACLLHSRVAVRDAVRRRLAVLREELRSGHLDEETLAAETAALADRVILEVEDAARAPYRRVINASGILIHTNLGRAPLARRAVAAACRAGVEPLALEYDLEEGRRGSRRRPVRDSLEELFPGHTGMAVGNNAAGVMLALNCWASGKDVLISRGELVEIGGSFRVPDILRQSGARLKEVGTTNRTRLDDFRTALTGETGAILRVHPSNLHQVGFTEQASPRELAELATTAGIPLIVDQGSGNLHELAPYGIHDEPTVASLLEAGAHLVTFSGDKLLGGPQAGLVVGPERFVEPLCTSPLARALRPDKMILAALVETLRLHQQGLAFTEIPVLRRIALQADQIRERAQRLSRRLQAGGLQPESLELRTGISRTGGGSAPSGDLPTVLVAVEAPDLEALAARLRSGTPAVVARVADRRLMVDLRSVDPEEDELLAEALLRARGESGGARNAPGRNT